MKKLRWQILVVVVTLIVVAVLLLTQQTTQQNPTLPEPVSGGIYTEALVGSFGRLNPLLDLNNTADREIDRLIFSSLVKFNSNGIAIPDLAESWGISADGTIYNITLRSNANWHDGVPVSADDVIFTISLLKSASSGFPQDVRSMWDQVDVLKLDDKNLKFTLPEPFVPFLDFLTFGILPKHLLETTTPEQLVNADFNLSPVGSGPYQFDHLTIENGTITGVVLTASTTYFGQVPFIDQIVFRYYPTAELALEAYSQGEVLGVDQIPADQISTTCAQTTMMCYSGRSPRLTMIFLNLGNNNVPYFQDKNIRHALMSGLNRQWMVDKVLMGQGVVANSPLLPQTWAYFDGVDPVTFDIDSAISQLKTAGYTLPAEGAVRAKDNVALSFSMVFPDDETHAQLAQAIQRDWAAIGVQVTLQPVSYESLFNDFLIPRNYQAALVDLDLNRSYDPDPYPFWHQAEITGGQNYSQWDNRAASEYLEQARVLADPVYRARLYRNFQVVFSRELPALPLFYPIFTYGIDQRVQGVQAAPLFEAADRFNNISSWYLVSRRALESTAQPSETP